MRWKRDRKTAFSCLMMGMVLILAAIAVAEERTDASGQWTYELVDGGAVITKSPVILGYLEESGIELRIPNELDGYPVTGISAGAFDECDLCGVAVIIPDSVTHIGENAIIDGGGCHYPTMAVLKGSAAEQYARGNDIRHFLIDASGQWKYTVYDMSAWWEDVAYDVREWAYTDFGESRWWEGILLDVSGRMEDAHRVGSATIVGFMEAPRGNLLIPSEVDGYPVTGVRNWVWECPGGGEPSLLTYPALTGVTIPDGVTRIGYGAFMGCANLTDVTIPDSVSYIDEYAFWRCGITSMTIPAGVNRIDENPFVSSALTRFDVSPDNPVYEQIDGVLFDKQQKMLVSYPGARKGPYAIPEGVVSIGEEAFHACGGLTSVTIPGSVTDIGYEAFAAWYEDKPDVVLCVQPGSYAEEYAKDKGLAYTIGDY